MAEARYREGCGREANDACLQCNLGDLAFCHGLPEPELRRLMTIQGCVRFDPQDTLFNEGDGAAYLFSPLNGAVKTYKLMADGRRQITGFFFRGDLFGFSPNGLYGYTAEAITGVSLCRFPVAKLEGIYPTAPTLVREVLRRSMVKLTHFHEHTLLLGRKSAPEKLASFLLSLSQRAVERGDTASPVMIPMGRADVADYLGLTIETVSRTLTKFKASGLLELPNPSTVALRDPGALRRIADGGA
jgi:CRP/FNR family transcriptional regulator